MTGIADLNMDQIGPSETRNDETALALGRRLIVLAVPIAISLGIGASISLVDSVLVAPLGSAALAAVALVGSVTLVISATLYGFLTMFGIRVAEADAAGRHDEAKAEFGTGIVLAAASGLVGLTIMGLCWPLLGYADQPEEVLSQMGPYWLASTITVLPLSLTMAYRLALEAVGRVWLGTGLALATVIANGLFGLVLIHGHLGLPAMGLTGAGIASLLANCFGLVLTVLAARLDRRSARIMVGFSFKLRILIAQARSGFAAGMQYLLETAASTVWMLMVGTFGTAALAANQIVSSIALTVYMMPLGVAVAAGLFVARLRGEGKHHLLRPAIRAALSIVTLIMGITAFIFWFAGAQIAEWFSSDSEVVAVATSLFIVLAVLQLFDGIQSVSIGALRGFHDVVGPAVITSLFLWCVGVPLSVLTGFWLFPGPLGVWGGASAALCVVSMVLMRRLWKLTATPSI